MMDETPPHPRPPENPYEPPQAQQAPKPPFAPPAGQLPRVMGGMIVVDRSGPPLPVDTCFKCNRPAESVKTRTLSWSSPLSHLILLLMIFLSLLAVLLWAIVRLVTRRRAPVNLGLCGRCRSRRANLVTCFIVGASLALGLGLYAAEGSQWGLFSAALLVFFPLILGAALASRLAVARRIDERWIWIAGAGPSFRRRFRESAPGPLQHPQGSPS